MCEVLGGDDNLKEDATNKEFSGAFAELLAGFEAVIPPAEVAEWHNKLLSVLQNVIAIFDLLPEDDTTDVGTALLVALTVQADMEEVEAHLPDDVRRQMVSAGCIEGTSADRFDEPEALVGTFGVGESVRVGDYLVELTDAYMEDEGTVSLEVDFQNAGGSPVPMPDWDTQMSLQHQDGSRYDRASASRNTVSDLLSPDATVYYSLTYVDVPEDAVGLTWKFSDGVSGAAFDLTGIGLLQASLETDEMTPSPTPAPTMAEFAPDDHGNDFESATRIAIGEAVAIELENLDDRDVLVFRLAPNREYVLTLDWETYEIWDNPGSIMALYDAGAQELASLDDYDFSEQRLRNKIMWQAVTGGDYYIAIGDENTLGNFAFTVSEGEATEPIATPTAAPRATSTPRPTPPAGSFNSVSTGGFHTCGVRGDGSVACWGDNGRAMPPAGSFVSVSAGGYHTCGLRSDGSVACWGDDNYGQATPPAGSFDAVSAGVVHTCGLRSDGSVACWGDDNYGQATPPRKRGEGATGEMAWAGSFSRRRQRRREPHLRGEEQRLRRLLGQRCSRPDQGARGFLRRRQRRVEPHLRGEEQRLRRLLGLELLRSGHAARGFLRRRKRRGVPHLRGGERRRCRLLGRQ